MGVMVIEQRVQTWRRDWTVEDQNQTVERGLTVEQKVSWLKSNIHRGSPVQPHVNVKDLRWPRIFAQTQIKDRFSHALFSQTAGSALSVAGYRSCGWCDGWPLDPIPGRGVVCLLSGDTEYRAEQKPTQRKRTQPLKLRTQSSRSSFETDNTVACAKKRRKYKTLPKVYSFTINFPASGAHKLKVLCNSSPFSSFLQSVVGWWVWLWSLLLPKRTQRVDYAVSHYYLPCSSLSLTTSQKRYTQSHPSTMTYTLYELRSYYWLVFWGAKSVTILDINLWHKQAVMISLMWKQERRAKRGKEKDTIKKQGQISRWRLQLKTAIFESIQQRGE